MTDVESRVQREIFCLNNVSIQLKFNTFVGCLSHICHQLGVARIARDVRRNQQVFHRIPIDIYRTAKTFFEETEIEAQVTGNGRFPFHIRIVDVLGIVELIIIVAHLSPAGRCLAAYSVKLLI